MPFNYKDYTFVFFFLLFKIVKGIFNDKNIVFNEN